jgi:hypothetical protein
MGLNLHLAVGKSSQTRGVFGLPPQLNITSGVLAYHQGQGITNFILKSGTNRFQGDMYENFRNTALDAGDALRARLRFEHQNEYGAPQRRIQGLRPKDNSTQFLRGQIYDNQ